MKDEEKGQRVLVPSGPVTRETDPAVPSETVTIYICVPGLEMQVNLRFPIDYGIGPLVEEHPEKIAQLLNSGINAAFQRTFQHFQRLTVALSPHVRVEIPDKITNKKLTGEAN